MKLSWTRPAVAIMGFGAVAMALGGPVLSGLGVAAVFFALLSVLRISESERLRLLVTHWRLFNVMLRITGLWFAFGGLVFLAWGIYFYAEPDSELSGAGQWSVFAGVGAFALVVGACLLARRGYRPDLGDQALSDRTRRWLAIYPPAYLPQRIPEPSERRSWWTGDRIGS